MEAAAENAEFERAANLRDRLEAVEAFHGEGGEAVSDHSDDRTVDVLAAAVEGDTARVARLHSERGQLVDRSRHRLDAAAVGTTTAREMKMASPTPTPTRPPRCCQRSSRSTTPSGSSRTRSSSQSARRTPT